MRKIIITYEPIPPEVLKYLLKVKQRGCNILKDENSYTYFCKTKDTMKECIEIVENYEQALKNGEI